MDFSKRRNKLRALLDGSKCLYPASVFDAVSARIADDLGFDVAMFAGSVASMTVLGAPDLMGLTLSEFAEQAYRITRANQAPLLVDADDGYGNAINVMRCVTELEQAGVSAMSLEDTALPQPFGRAGKPQLVSIDEGVACMRAAIEARHDPNFIIAGRTSAAEVTNLDDAIARLKAYVEAGADAVFPVGLTTREQVTAVHQALGVPMIVYVGNQALEDLQFMADNGVRIALQPHVPFIAAFNAVYETLNALKNGARPSEILDVEAGKRVSQAIRKSDYDRWMRDYVN